MQNRGILMSLRAAAIVVIVTGVNDVIASAIPRYEPLYLYLAAVALVGLLDGVIVAVAAAILSIAFYGLLFMPRADALSPRIAIPAVAALAAAIVASLIRGFVRSRRHRPEPHFVVSPPLLETSAVAHVTAGNEEVLAAIDELRGDLRTAVANLGASRTRQASIEDDLRAATRALAASREEAAAMAGRIAELELSLREAERFRTEAATERARAEGEKTLRERAERETLAERSRGDEMQRTLHDGRADADARVAAERERAAALERELAIARAETSAMAGRIAELELSLHEAERFRTEAATERARAEGEKTLRERAERETTAERSRGDEMQRILHDTRADADARVAAERERAAELERELASARAETPAMAGRIAELEAALAEERAQFDTKLQTIVTHLASDHEADLGQALSDKEEARAEARAIGVKLAALQRRYDEQHEAAEALLRETRAAAQAEIDRLSKEIAPPARPRILVVHPDADLRSAASATLERAGYEVVGAADGLEALRVAIARQPEIVIAESSMPKMDGRELCQLLKSQQKTAHIRFVLLMRGSDKAPHGELIPDEVLRKPVAVETLKATLASLLAPANTR